MQRRASPLSKTAPLSRNVMEERDRGDCQCPGSNSLLRIGATQVTCSVSKLDVVKLGKWYIT